MKTFKLYVTDAIDALVNEEFICEADSIGAITMRISAEIQDRGFHEEPYWRYLGLPSGLAIDFGSWSKFFFIQEASISDLC